MTNQPRLLPDFAAVPTASERHATRQLAQNAQTSMFDYDADAAPTCAVCASTEHASSACPHGTALTLI